MLLSPLSAGLFVCLCMPGGFQPIISLLLSPLPLSLLSFLIVFIFYHPHLKGQPDTQSVVNHAVLLSFQSVFHLARQPIHAHKVYTPFVTTCTCSISYSVSCLSLAPSPHWNNHVDGPQIKANTVIRPEVISTTSFDH